MIAGFNDTVNTKYDTDYSVDFYDPAVNGVFRVEPVLGVRRDRGRLHRIADTLDVRLSATAKPVSDSSARPPAATAETHRSLCCRNRSAVVRWSR